jgi:crossover junction endodeoxyribonuclease RuvC
VLVVIVGIDPGLTHTGWGVIENEDDRWRARAYGCVDTSPRQPMAHRLQLIHEGLREVIVRYGAQHAAIEDVFAGTNVRTAFALGQARGCALLACSYCAGTVGEYPPNTIKMNVVGYGHADKEQVGYMVQMLLGLDHLPKPDHCSDALAIALTHAFALSTARLREVGAPA